MLRGQSRVHGRRGVTMVATLVSMPVLLGFVALAVDVGMTRSLQADLQRAADAVALAAAQDLGGVDAAASMALAEATALSYIQKNPVFNDYVIQFDPAVDIVYGQASLVTNGGGKVDFLPNLQPPSAIQVTLHATVDYTFAKILGLGSRQFNATAIAASGPRDFVVVIDCSGSMTKQSDETEVMADLDALGIPYPPPDPKKPPKPGKGPAVKTALALTYDGSDPQFASVYNIGDKFLPPSVRIQPMKATKDAAAYSVGIVESAGFDDQVAAVAFSSTIEWVQELTTDYTSLQAKLLGATKYGGTRIDLGIEAARLELLSIRAREGADKVIVLMTDGNSDFDLAMQQAQLAVDAGMTVHTIGLGLVDPVLLDSIAALGNGKSLYVTNYTDPSVYGPALQEVFQSLAGEVGYVLIK